MGKMDEMILAVDRGHLFQDELFTFQGVLTNKVTVRTIMKKFNKYIQVRRGDAEEDKTLKQPIPYAIVRRGEEVFLYKRLSAGGEARLHDQLSIGVGGHMNKINDIRNWDENLMINFHRELGEELHITMNGVMDPKIIGLINDDEGPAGLYHVGILLVLDLPEHAEVSVRETDQLEGCWVRTQDLTKSPLFEGLESWSQMIVKAGVL